MHLASRHVPRSSVEGALDRISEPSQGSNPGERSISSHFLFFIHVSFFLWTCYFFPLHTSIIKTVKCVCILLPFSWVKKRFYPVDHKFTYSLHPLTEGMHLNSTKFQHYEV